MSATATCRVLNCLEYLEDSNTTSSANLEEDTYESYILTWTFGWAVWYSSRMGYRNQWQILGRKVPNFGWATFGRASCFFDSCAPLVLHWTSRSSSSYILAYVPGSRFGSVILLDSLDPHCT